jgi:hypothetical protein
MNYAKKVDFSARLTSQAEAKKALLERFKPKATVQDPNFVSREERKAAEREALRAARAAEKQAAEAEKAARAEAARQARIADEEAALAQKRSDRKDRKQLEKMDAQARKAARMQAYSRVSTSIIQGQEA